jgi:DNA-binding Lrp family transcriptional regulator
MQSGAIDDLDRAIIHALQTDGRAPFSRIAYVLDTSENTIARRYQRLRSAGLLRVVGTLVGPRLGYDSWTIRIRCSPDAATEIAAALARRADTYWVQLLSGGTEISCNTQARTAAERDALLLEKLPRTNRVTSITAHAILEGFATPMSWFGLRQLTADQVADLAPEQAPPSGQLPVLEATESLLFEALGRDGRASYPELAVATGWSVSTVKRRIDDFRREGLLCFFVDITAAALGFRAEARLWMSVRPAKLRAVGEVLGRHPEVSFAALTTGPTNLMATVACRDSRDLSSYLTDRISALDGITQLESAPVIRTVKGAGSILPVLSGRR